MYCTNVQKCTQDYLSLGFAIFPCNGKIPATAHGVKDASKNPEQVAKWFGQGTTKNIGIACGEPSGVFVLDVDNADDLKKLTDQNGLLPKTWTVRTGSGGTHFYFGFDARCTLLKNAVKFAGGLDVRTTGGYVVAPPSIHPVTQKRYEWIVSPDDCELASAPDWLLALIPKHGEMVPAKSMTLTIQRAKTLEERVGLFLQAAPIAVSGEDGHGTTFGLCCSLVENFGTLDDETLLASLVEWNDRCDPPWNESDLRRKILEARKRVVTLNAENDPLPTPDLPTLEAEAYHGLAGNVLRTLEPSTEAAPAALLLTFLTAFSVAVGRNPHFIVEGRRVHPNLYSAVVGRSSRSRKGTSLGRIQDLFEKVNVPKLSGLSSGEGLISALRDDETSQIQGKFVTAGGVQDKRLWIIESEFARTLKTMKREGNSLSAILRDAWDVGDIASMTKGNPLRASGVHLGITTHITSDELRQTMADVDAVNGFANRFLWSFVTKSKSLPFGGDDLDTTTLRSRVADAVEKAKTIGRMTRSGETNTLWALGYNSLTDEKESPAWDSVTSRAEGQVLRLSMLFALLDCTPQIDVVHLRAALAVWRYCDDSARLLFSDVKTKPETFEEKVVDHVRNQPGITRSDLRKKFHHGSDARSRFDSTLESLISRKELVCVPCWESRQVDRLYVGTLPLVHSAESTTGADDLSALGESETVAESKSGAESLSAQRALGTRSQTAKPMELGEFFDWKNANAVTFTKRENGVFWVTQAFAPLLTPEIEATITGNQSIVSTFVAAATPTIMPSGKPYWLPADEPLDDETFLRELTEM